MTARAFSTSTPIDSSWHVKSKGLSALKVSDVVAFILLQRTHKIGNQFGKHPFAILLLILRILQKEWRQPKRTPAGKLNTVYQWYYNNHGRDYHGQYEFSFRSP